MANTDPQTVKFLKENGRSLANLLYHSYFETLDYQIEYNAKSIGTLINNVGAAEVIQDGTEFGITPVTGGTVFLQKKLVDDLEFWLRQQNTANPADGTRLSLLALMATQKNGG